MVLQSKFLEKTANNYVASLQKMLLFWCYTGRKRWICYRRMNICCSFWASKPSFKTARHSWINKGKRLKPSVQAVFDGRGRRTWTLGTRFWRRRPCVLHRILLWTSVLFVQEIGFEIVYNSLQKLYRRNISSTFVRYFVRCSNSFCYNYMPQISGKKKADWYQTNLPYF